MSTKSTNYQACGQQLSGAACIQPMLVRHMQRLLRQLSGAGGLDLAHGL